MPGIALSAFVLAAEAAGLGCACISAIRNHAAEVSDLLGLPDHVFPVAGLGLGWPARETTSACGCRCRQLCTATVSRRPHPRHGRCLRPPARGRAADPRAARIDRFGTAEFYGWSEDKVRQYAGPERADWGAFVRGKGFKLE